MTLVTRKLNRSFIALNSHVCHSHMQEWLLHAPKISGKHSNVFLPLISLFVVKVGKQIPFLLIYAKCSLFVEYFLCSAEQLVYACDFHFTAHLGDR